MNYQTDRPIYLQVIENIRQRLIRGELQLGEKLPSVRELAKQYQINPNTASRVYREMEMTGLCYTRRGTGTFITEDADMMKQIRKEMASECLEDFFRRMQKMGFTLEEMIEMLRQHEEHAQMDSHDGLR